MRTKKGTNEGFLSDADVRSRVVLEILNTEKDYVKNLEDVVEVSVPSQVVDDMTTTKFLVRACAVTFTLLPVVVLRSSSWLLKLPNYTIKSRESCS